MINRQADLTVCLPLHDPNNTNREFLHKAILSILKQTELPRQIVFTSNHPIGYLSDLLSLIPKEINVVNRIAKTSGASQNFNNAVSSATSSYVKILCQDDFLINPEHFEESILTLKSSKSSWLATGCVHYEDELKIFSREIHPRYRSKLLKGVNTIGSPSVILFERSKFLPFSENLDFMYDCEWYVRMFHRFGMPFLSKSIDIGIRIHSNQSTNIVSEKLSDEIFISGRLHSKSKFSSRGNCLCLHGVNLLE
jgi:glycosyltransferase involved in cell wall biosynthesis